MIGVVFLLARIKRNSSTQCIVHFPRECLQEILSGPTMIDRFIGTRRRCSAKKRGFDRYTDIGKS